MSNKEIVNLIHRLGECAELTDWEWKDDCIFVHEDFFPTLCKLMDALGIRVKCPYYRKEDYGEREEQEDD